jgi:hypothetical protein
VNRLAFTVTVAELAICEEKVVMLGEDALFLVLAGMWTFYLEPRELMAIFERSCFRRGGCREEG